MKPDLIVAMNLNRKTERKKVDSVDESDYPLDALIKRSGCLHQQLAPIDCM